MCSLEKFPAKGDKSQHIVIRKRTTLRVSDGPPYYIRQEVTEGSLLYSGQEVTEGSLHYIGQVVTEGPLHYIRQKVKDLYTAVDRK